MSVSSNAENRERAETRSPDRVRRAALLISAGISVALLSLLGTSPEAFMSFIAISGGLIGLGMVDFALTLWPRSRKTVRDS